MSLEVLLLVLFAAAIHAGWNALVKGSGATAATSRAVAIGAGLVGLALLPFLAAPAPAARPWLVLSAGLQIGYFLLLGRTYRFADLSVAYPLMRGLAPLLVAVASVGIFGERLGLAAWVGVAAISAGIAGLVFARLGGGRGIPAAILNAGVIAAYTLVDGHGVRLSGSPFAYAAWEAILTAVPFLAWALVAHVKEKTRASLRLFLFGLLGGAATTASYALALWAMTRAPVPMVASLRETSIVFALVLGHRLLGEPIGPRRLAAVSVVVAGVVALRLA